MLSMRVWCAMVLAAAVQAAGVAPALRLRGGGKHFKKLPDSIKPGVIYGDALKDLLQHAKDNNYAIPAVNCVSSSGVNQVLEAAAKFKSPVMIQFSNGGSQFYAGKTIESTKENGLKGCVLGAIAVSFSCLRPARRPRAPCWGSALQTCLLVSGFRAGATDKKGVTSLLGSAPGAARCAGGARSCALWPDGWGLIALDLLASSWSVPRAGGQGRPRSGLLTCLYVGLLCRVPCT